MVRYVRRVLSRSRGRPVSPEEAQDVVQSFLVACLEHQWLTRADPHAGRFRAYLQVLLRRHAYRVIRHATAKRRQPGGGLEIFSIRDQDTLQSVAPEERSEFDEFSQSWVETAVERTLTRLAEEHDRYRIVIEDLIRTDGEGSADLAELVGLHPEQLPVLKHRSRKRFCRLFEDELADTVGNQEAFEEEWRAIQPFLPKGV